MAARTKEEIIQTFPNIYSEKLEPKELQKRVDILDEIIKVFWKDEYVFYVFFSSEKRWKYAYVVVTNRRVIICGEPSTFLGVGNLLGNVQYKLESYSLEIFCDFKVKEEVRGSAYRIKAYNQYQKLSMDFGLYDLASAEEITNKFRDALIEIKNFIDIPQTVPVQQTSAIEEIKGYKELLDMGAISQEEFDAKKKQLLGI